MTRVAQHSQDKNIDEGVYLADRVLLLSWHPAGVRDELDVPIRRPRSRSDSSLFAPQGLLLHSLAEMDG